MFLFKKIKFINYCDPFLPNCTFKKKLNKKSIKLDKKNLKNHDIVIIATDHDEFNYDLIKNKSNFIIDCRGRYSLNKKIVRG